MSTLQGKAYHPTNGSTEQVWGGFSWPCFFFGFFWYLYKGMWGWAAISFIVSIVTYGFGWLIFPFFANEQHAKSLLAKGYLTEKQWYEKQNPQVSSNVIDINSVALIEKKFGFKSISAKNVGGSGYPLSQGQEISFGINTSSIIIIKINDSLDVIDIPFEEINEVEVSGPGTVATDAGMSGGGFGLEGFIQGAAAAALINAATTRKTTNTFMRIMTATGEIYIHTSEIEPDALKIKFSPVFVYLKNKANQQFKIAGSSIAEEIERLQKLFKDGILTQEEFDAAKKKVIAR